MWHHEPTWEANENAAHEQTDSAQQPLVANIALEQTVSPNNVGRLDDSGVVEAEAGAPKTGVAGDTPRT